MKITADRKRKRPPREIVWTTHPPPSTRRVAPHNIRTKRRRISDEAQAAVTEEDFWSLFITVKNLYTRWRCSFDFRVWPKQCCSVADPGCLSRIPDPTFFHPGSRIRTVSIPNHGSASKNLSIVTLVTQNIVSKLSEIWSRMFFAHFTRFQILHFQKQYRPRF